MLRGLIRALAIVVIVAAVLVVLDFAELLVPAKPGDAFMAETIPACDGRVLAEGLTYRFWDPEPGQIVAVRAAVTAESEVVPDPDADDRTLVLRVAAGPGDVIVARQGSVFVDDVKFDDLQTAPFGPLTVPNEQYFLLGDNRSGAIDSRRFGPVLKSAIFARVFMIFWPLRELTFRLGQGSGASPGPISCE